MSTESMRYLCAALLALLSALVVALDTSAAGALNESDLAPIANLAQTEIAAGRIPGAVVLIGAGDTIVYRKAFGNRVLGPHPEPMKIGTVFDLASLTKVVATTPAVMQLDEQGKLQLDSPVARYWPAFAANGKDAITVRDLLTHYSGMRADLDLSTQWSGYDTAMNKLVAEKPPAPPETRFLYSDENFEVLGELVRRVSGQPLDAYCADHIFGPLGMKHTEFLPPAALHDQIAPTEDTQGKVHWGDVHDATARWMGGVSGHAGVFSTADDLAIYARMLLNGGVGNGVRILSQKSVEEMTTRESPPNGPRARGLGWDMGGRDGYSMFPDGSYGHTGFTGTLIWIDPGAAAYVIVLTNRVYPDGKGDALPLRKGVLELVTRALDPSIQRASDSRN
ncbi:MAG: serine hydrolase domain-containing protein [Candidatus Binataceae bacterium]